MLVEIAVGSLGVAGIAAAILAWRLSQGPIDLTGFVQRQAAGLTAEGARLSIGRAALAWEGFFAADSPLDLRLDDITLRAPDGTALLSLPRGRVTLSLTQLLRGRVVPRAIELDRPVLALVRTASGQLQLDVGQAQGGRGNAVVAELAHAPRAESAPSGPLPLLSEIRTVHIRDAAVTVQDAVLGRVWRADDASADLRRRASGGVSGSATLDMAVGAMRVKLAASAELTASGTQVNASTGAFDPARLADIAPELAPLGAIDAPARVALVAELAPDLAPRRGTLSLTLGAGMVRAGKGTAAIRSAAALAELTPDHARLTQLTIAMAAPPGAAAPPPTLTATGALDRVAGGFAVPFTVHIDRAAFGDLAAYWPLGTGGGARPWVTENITAGTAHDGTVTGMVTLGPGFSNPALTALSGGIAAEGMTLWWLRPIPPLTGVAARLSIDGPDAIRIAVTSGAQGRLRLQGGTVRITGLTQKDQIGDIDADIAGPLSEALGLLGNKRLSLLSRFPLKIEDPKGDVRTQLTVHLPLDVRVTMDDIGIAAKGTLSDVHLGGAVAGRDLDDGRLKLAVDTNQLTLGGRATVAGIPADFTYMNDFRAGPPTQVLERVSAKATASAHALRGAGMPGWLMTGGSASLVLGYTRLRDRSAGVDVSADLSQAVLATPAGWSKPAGEAATASASLLLQGDRLIAINAVRADGPGLMLRGRARTGAASNQLDIDRAVLGRTDLHGTVSLPQGNEPIAVRLAGPALDVSPFLHPGGEPPAASGDSKPGPAWEADLAFGTVILGPKEQVSPVALTAASDGRRITHARLEAASGGVRASIEPSPAGRHLSIRSADSGAVLEAAGVTDSIRRGSLRVEADYADAEPHAPLSGTATLDRFRVTDAPAAGRILKAMTLYGALDLLRGPGLGFERAVVPFRWERQVLHVESARAYSASLGLTAKGDIDLATRRADITGTIVPAYFFNTLLGRLPLVGHLFSPEKGGGVFAARYSVKGPLGDPKVGINPLSVLTPGFLRGIFGPG